MKRSRVVLLAIFSMTACAHMGDNFMPLAESINAPADLNVTSSSFAANGPIPMAHVFSGMGCTGQNISPELSWSGAPNGTKGYAVIMHDPDAPTGVGFFHWAVFDLPAASQSLPAGAAAKLPAGVQHATVDIPAAGYSGPCPPVGDPPHRYVVTVYALDTNKLGLDSHASAALLRFMLKQHTVAYGRLIGTFGR